MGGKVHPVVEFAESGVVTVGFARPTRRHEISLLNVSVVGTYLIVGFTFKLSESKDGIGENRFYFPFPFVGANKYDTTRS